MCFSIIFVMVLSLSLSCPLTAVAEDGNFFAVNDTNNTFYVFDTDSSAYIKKFIIPSTYYVKVIGSVNNDYLPVVYMGISGYIKVSTAPTTVSSITNPYPNVTITLTDVKVKPNSTDSRYSFETLSSDKILYLGSFTDADSVKWYALSIDSTSVIYYAKATNTTSPELTVTAHPNSTSLPSDGNGQTDTTTDDDGINNTVVRIILIIGIVIPAMIILFLIFKPHKKNVSHRRLPEDKHDDDYYDGYYRR